MTAQHTPGPWAIATVREDDASWFEVRGDADGEGWQTVVAEVDNRHDARLIAAAPDLLAALEWLRANLRESTTSEVEARLDQAIAKAKGGAA